MASVVEVGVHTRELDRRHADRVLPVHALIVGHLTDPDLSTARIARELACNPDYLGRTFREAFNETPTDRIHRLRIARACLLFRSTDRPIERVATDVGFGGVRYFRRV